MVYNVRQLEPNDYEDLLVGWWKDWRWSAPPKDFLPDNGTGGILVSEDDKPICAGFLYQTNSGVAWVDWIISDFQYKDRESRKDAISLLIDTLTQTAKAMGYKYTYALIKNKGLIDVYKSLGYTEGDVYNSEMIKRL